MSWMVIQGDARRLPLGDRSIHAVVSSPPYFNLRDYGEENQIGLEESPDLYVDATRAVFRELWRVLRDDGVVFWNVGESYNAYNGNRGSSASISGKNEEKHPLHGRGLTVSSLKPKDIIGIPYRLAMAVQADGWYWRDTIIWAKAEMVDDELDGSGMPGSQQDRCTNGYEVVLQFAKSDRYYFDIHGERSSSGATLRNVWRINTEPNKLGHFALMPRKLAERCIRLGTSEKGCCPACGSPWRRLVERQRAATRPGNNSKVHGRVSVHADSPYHDQNGAICGNRDPKRHTTVFRTIDWEPTCRCGIDETEPCRVLDPFGGLSTTAVAADALGRAGITIDLSRKYCTTAHRRLSRPHAPVIHPTNREESFPLFEEVQS